MSPSDWAYLTESLASNLVSRGVNAGFTPPPGSDEIVFALDSTDAVTAAVGLLANRVGFAPMPLGGAVRGVGS